MTTILIVDDEPSLRDMLGILLRKEGFGVVTADSRATAARVLGAQTVDLVLTDLRLPDGDGIEILRHVKAASPETLVIVMTAFGSTETAVAALKLGAHDYLMKPFDVEELKIVLRNALERQDLKQEVSLLKAELHAQNALDRIIGRSTAFTSVLATVRAVAATNSTILLTGESGTGKEVLANAIHDASPRRERSFVSINCAALPEQLLESEMFGHVKGAFTDAHQNKKGLFETAHRGTLFLDEVGEMPASMQVKLLRALQERRIRRVGGTDEIEVDVRIVGATNRALESMIAEGRFREDLYYRLNVIPIRVPPLRERAEDVPLLVEHFVKQLAARMGKNPPSIPPEDMLTLEKYPWPGNVRELENVIERALALGVSPASLTNAPHLPTRTVPGAAPAALGEGFDLGAHLHAEEEKLLRQALTQARGDRSVAAQLLGVNARGLRYLLSKHPSSDTG